MFSMRNDLCGPEQGMNGSKKGKNQNRRLQWKSRKDQASGVLSDEALHFHLPIENEESNYAFELGQLC